MRTKERQGIRTKALLQVALPLVALIALVGGLVYWRAKTALERSTASDLQNLTLALRGMVETSYKLNQRRVQSNLEYLSAVTGDVAALDAKAPTTLAVTDQISGAKRQLTLPALRLGGKVVLGNDALLDAVSAKVGGTATLFQMIPGGMLRVATSVRKPNGERATLTYIPESSPVYKAVIAGEQYVGRALVAGQWSVTAYRPVRDAAGHVVAAVFTGLPQTSLDELRERVARFRIGEHGYVQILDGEGRQIVHPDAKLEGQLRKDDPDVAAMLQQKDGRLVAGGMVYELASIPDMSWILAAGATEGDLDAPLAAMRRWMIAVLLGATVLAYLLARRFGGKLAAAVAQASAMLQDIARGAGDLTRRLEERGADEVAAMAGWFNEFVGKLQGTVREVASSAVQVSSTSDSLTETAGELDHAMERLRARAGAIAGGSAEAATSLDKVSAASADFASALTGAASAIEQMGATIRAVSASCREESRATAEARTRAVETTTVVASLEAAAREVGGVVGVIEEIAGQTHLLALNAAIEAAGAGAAGKGFRIVADEVKALSQQTAEATGQIQQRVERMLAEAARAVHTVGEIGQVIGKVDELSAGIEHMLKEQSEAVTDISRTVSGLDGSARAIAGSVKGSAAALVLVKTDTADVDREIAGAAERQRALRVQIERLASAAHELETVSGSFRT